MQGFSEIAASLILILKTSSNLASTLLVIIVDNSKAIGTSSGNDIKSAKSDFIKPMYGAEKPSFPTPDARQAFCQLR